MNKKYRHAAVVWYTRKHMAEMDGFQFMVDAPPKNMKERKDRFVADTDKTLVSLDNAIEGILDASVNVSRKIDHKGREVMTKIKAKPWAQRVMAKFAKKDNNERRASMNEEAEDNQIHDEIPE